MGRNRFLSIPSGGPPAASGTSSPDFDFLSETPVPDRPGILSIPVMSARFGRYEVIGKLGEGAMAAVHLARDPLLTRFVAVKVLHRSVAEGEIPLRRFFNEAKTVANVRSPHVVEIFDFGREGGESGDYYLVMEFVDGSSLHRLLAPPRASGTGRPQGPAGAVPEGPGRRLEETVAAALLCQAAEGLDAASRQGVVHRDIKPENLMINTHGYLKIADFGIAHLQDESLTRTGAVLGSPLYMSPEQVRGAKPINSQSDMFSLGAVLYRCLAGEPPFASPNLKELYRKIASEPHLPLRHARPDLDPALAAIAETLLEKNPAHRGGGPRWLRAELRAYLLSKGIDDAMERAARHLREQVGQEGPSSRGADSHGAASPRTVAATLPAGGSRSWSRSRTVPADAQRRGSIPRTVGLPEAAAVQGKGRGSWWMVSSVAMALALAGIGGGWILTAGGGASGDAWIAAGPSPERVASTAQDAPARTRNRKVAGKAPSTPGSGGASDSGAGMAESGPAAAYFQVPEGPSGTARRETGSHPQPLPPLQPPSELGSTPEPGPDKGPDTGYRPSAETSAAETVTLLVHSSPPFAEVYLDGRFIGVTPARIHDVAAGSHRLLVQGRSGRPLDTLLQVPQGRTAIRVRLGPLAAAMERED